VFNVKNKQKYHAVLSLSLLDDNRERVTLKRGSVIQMQDQPEQVVVELRGSQRRSGRFDYFASVVSRLGPSVKITRSATQPCTCVCVVGDDQWYSGTTWQNFSTYFLQLAPILSD